MDTNHKPLINVLLEAIAKRHNIDLNLKNVDLQNIRFSNLQFLYKLVEKDEDTRNPHDLKLIDFMANEMIDLMQTETLLLRTGSDPEQRNLFFPNFRPTDHFAKDEEVYVEVLGYSHGSIGKNIGFIKTVVEEVFIDGWNRVKIKTFPDLLPNTHHMSHPSEHCSLNYGRLLKASEFEALKVLVNTDPEFVDLFKTNSSGCFHSLEMYDISRYDKKLMDEEAKRRPSEAARNCV